MATPRRHTPKIPKPATEGKRQARTRYEVLKESELNRNLHKIQKAVEELEELIDQFEESHMNDMSDVKCADLGIAHDAPDGWADWSQESFEDVQGFKWALQLFVGAIHPIVDADPDDAAEADEPTVVASH